MLGSVFIFGADADLDDSDDVDASDFDRVLLELELEPPPPPPPFCSFLTDEDEDVVCSFFISFTFVDCGVVVPFRFAEFPFVSSVFFSLESGASSSIGDE